MLFFILASDILVRYRSASRALAAARRNRGGARVNIEFVIDALITVVGVTTPILLAATGELVVEKSGVLNLGVEGMMLIGAVDRLRRGLQLRQLAGRCGAVGRRGRGRRSPARPRRCCSPFWC